MGLPSIIQTIFQITHRVLTRCRCRMMRIYSARLLFYFLAVQAAVFERRKMRGKSRGPIGVKHGRSRVPVIAVKNCELGLCRRITGEISHILPRLFIKYYLSIRAIRCTRHEFTCTCSCITWTNCTLLQMLTLLFLSLLLFLPSPLLPHQMTDYITMASRT